MPRYTYQSAPGLQIRMASFTGTAQEFADALAEDCPGDYQVQPNVRVWNGDGPVTEPPAATSKGVGR